MPAAGSGIDLGPAALEHFPPPPPPPKKKVHVEVHTCVIFVSVRLLVPSQIGS